MRPNFESVVEQIEATAAARQLYPEGSTVCR